jgi:hypothetical protein
MARTKGVAEPLNVEFACTGFPGELETRCGFHGKNQYGGPSRVDLQPGRPYPIINE